jgi:hypothetical protein
MFFFFLFPLLSSSTLIHFSSTTLTGLTNALSFIIVLLDLYISISFIACYLTSPLLFLSLTGIVALRSYEQDANFLIVSNDEPPEHQRADQSLFSFQQERNANRVAVAVSAYSSEMQGDKINGNQEVIKGWGGGRGGVRGGRSGRGGSGRGERGKSLGNERIPSAPPTTAGGRGGGNGRGNGGAGVSASTVDEEMRIRFTSQLHQLRESQVTEVQFPSTLNNVVSLSSLLSLLSSTLRPLLGKKISS